MSRLKEVIDNRYMSGDETTRVGTNRESYRNEKLIINESVEIYEYAP